MKITIKQLKQLIREAAYEGPGTASLTTIPHSGVSTKVSNRRESHISKLRLTPGSKYVFSELQIYFAENPSKISSRMHGHILNRRDLADVLLTLGFSEAAIRGVNFSSQGASRDGSVRMDVSKLFVAEWKDLIGTLAIDL